MTSTWHECVWLVRGKDVKQNCDVRFRCPSCESKRAIKVQCVSSRRPVQGSTYHKHVVCVRDVALQSEWNNPVMSPWFLATWSHGEWTDEVLSDSTSDATEAATFISSPFSLTAFTRRDSNVFFHWFLDSLLIVDSTFIYMCCNGMKTTSWRNQAFDL